VNPAPSVSDLTRSCVRTLEAWSAPSEAQELLRQLYLDHLLARSDGWSRQCPGAHLTASSVVWAPAEHAVLLVLHAKIGRWLQTGGHVEPDDRSLGSAALREAQEESGIESLHLEPGPLLLSRHQVDCGGRPTYHLDVQFLVLAPVASPPRFGAESRDVRWFAPSALPDVDESVRDLVTAAADRLNQS